jgi:hypothetical protein
MHILIWVLWSAIIVIRCLGGYAMWWSRRTLVQDCPGRKIPANFAARCSTEYLEARGNECRRSGSGGSHIGKPALPVSESIRLIHQAIDRGITFMDNSWDYNEGQSEMRMGEALSQSGYREKPSP